MENPEKMATKHKTKSKKTILKHNTIFVGHRYAQANTNNINKT